MNTTLREGISWIGVVDWTVRDFHGYTTERGSTYNSYFLQDEHPTVIDTVKAPFCDEWLKKLSNLTDPAKVAYVVCNHAEPDHSGSLPAAMRHCSNATLICDRKCHDILARHYDISGWKIQVVETGDEISLGERTLQFVETPMVHWPESMI